MNLPSPGAFAARLVLNSSRHSIQMELPIVFSKTAKTTKTRRTPSLLLCSGAIDRGVRQNRRAPLAQLASLHKLENRRPPNMNLLDQSASASHLVQIHCLSQRQVLRGAQSAMRRIRRRGLRRDQTFIHSSGGFTWAKQASKAPWLTFSDCNPQHPRSERLSDKPLKCIAHPMNGTCCYGVSYRL